jgi:hypothetical protein
LRSLSLQTREYIMQMTLLHVVNKFLDYTDNGSVSTIDDTLESQQVASVAEKVFYDLHDDVFSNEMQQELVKLESLADSEKPNYLRLPDGASRIKESVVMYDTTTDPTEIIMTEMDYMPPVDFLSWIGKRKVKTTNQVVVDFSGFKMTIENNKAPEYYTSFDDEHLVFDSYDSSVDSVMQNSKSGILTSNQPTFTVNDTYVIGFPEWFHTTYLNAVIAEASAVLREEPIPMVARQARLGIIKARKKRRIGTENKHRRNYGR